MEGIYRSIQQNWGKPKADEAAKGNEFVNGVTIEAEGDVMMGDAFVAQKIFYGDPREHDKRSVYKGDAFVKLKDYKNGPINPNSCDDLTGDGFVSVKQGKRRPDTARNIEVFLPDGTEYIFHLPKGGYKLVDLKNRLKTDRLIDNVDKAIFELKDDDGKLYEFFNDDYTLESWDEIHVSF